MKSIILSLLLTTSTLFSSQVVSNLVYSAPGVKIYVVTIITDTTNVVSQPVVVPPTQKKAVTNPCIDRLKAQIQKEEKRIHEDYDGLNTTFADISSPQSDYALRRLQEMWVEKNTAVSNLNVLKLKLQRLKERYGIPQ